ncbi:MAG: hypothetical protein AAF492_21195, partial [Verrucomicrobiota bacterium]
MKRRQSRTRFTLFSWIAIGAVLAGFGLPAGAQQFHQESFENAPNASTYLMNANYTDGSGDYFQRATDAVGGYAPDPNNEDGSYYIMAEDMDSNDNPLPGASNDVGSVTLATIDTSSRGALGVAIFVTQAIGSNLEAGDFIELQYKLNGTGTFQTLAAWYGIGSNTRLHEDTDLNGAGDS